MRVQPKLAKTRKSPVLKKRSPRSKIKGGGGPKKEDGGFAKVKQRIKGVFLSLEWVVVVVGNGGGGGL